MHMVVNRIGCVYSKELKPYESIKRIKRNGKESTKENRWTNSFLVFNYNLAKLS